MDSVPFTFMDVGYGCEELGCSSSVPINHHHQYFNVSSVCACVCVCVTDVT